MIKSMEHLSFLIFCACILCFFKNSKAGDSVTPTLPLSYGQTLVSAGGRFELGFFNRESTENRYLGIWYKELSSDDKVVWVANRESPLNQSNGILKISNEGKLVLHNQTGNIVWSSSSSKTTQNPVVAQLLNTGNLVVREQNNTNLNSFLWQSFDYPGDTLIPGMKLGLNFRTGKNWFLTSWKTTEDASPSDYKFGIDTDHVLPLPQLVAWQGEQEIVRVGHWNGIRFSGVPYLNENPSFVYDFISNEDEMYFTMKFNDNSSVGNLVSLNQSHLKKIVFYGWEDNNHNWFQYIMAPWDQCNTYNFCGVNGYCSDNSPALCQCLDGFVPKFPKEWNSMNWSSGCLRRMLFDCGKGEGFRKFEGMKLPDIRTSVVIEKMGLAECEEVCLKNCSCTAYAIANIKEGNGCLLWFGVLIDMRTFPRNGDELYVKMAASDLEISDTMKGGLNKKKRLIIIVTCASLLLGMLLLGFTVHIWKRKKQQKKKGCSQQGDYLALY